MRKLDRLLAFDPETGTLTCEAGVMLSEIIDVFLPRGWFVPVTPGTKWVTVGGMTASDVHGKNHHGAGSFCDHLEELELLTPQGEVLRCSRTHNGPLFAATCGGMGLTGVILSVTFRLTPVETAQIVQRTIRARNLDEAIDLFEASHSATYSVAWIDCLARGADLGRSVIFLGEHARVEDLPANRRSRPLDRPVRGSKRVPLDLPEFLLSKPAVQIFNFFYFHGHRPGQTIVDIEPFFYPLDSIRDWNRIYGSRGLVQYQPVLPLEESRIGVTRLLQEITRAGSASFLAVLKRMGQQSFGLLSFPMPGYTLALDFPVTAKNLDLLHRLDAIVAEHGGRLYLAKDARQGADMVAAGYPGAQEFKRLRREMRWDRHYRSLQSQRLDL